MASNEPTRKCPKCAFENGLDLKSCEICGGDISEPDVEEDGEERTIPQFSIWRCIQCTFDNSATIDRCEMCYCPRYEERRYCPRDEERRYSSRDEDDEHYQLEDETRIILVGRTGSGKSATANNILNHDVFNSKASCSSVTDRCQQGQAIRFNRSLQIVDTPGMFDTSKDNDTVTREILRCVGLTAPGPHAILLVVGIGRFTEEERETIRLLQKAFGTNMTRYLIIVFTRKDDLDKDGRSLQDMIDTAPLALRKTLSECDNRCIAVNNNGDEAEREQQVQDLLKIVDDVVNRNGGGYFTSTIFERGEGVIQEREEEIRCDNRKHFERQISDMERQVNDDYRQRMLDMDEEKMQYTRELRLLRLQKQELTESSVRRGKQSWRRPSETENTDVMIEQKVNELEYKLKEIQKQQEVIKSSTQLTLQQREREVRQKLHEMNSKVRAKVRKEVESGDSGILRRLWGRITDAGHEIIDKFRSIFESLKQKFGT